MDTKAKYIQLCEEESTIPVFSQPWWLDAVCGPNDWDVVLVEKGGKIWASMPYYMPRRDVIAMPQLTQTMGPWIRECEGKYSKVLSQEKELMTKLIQQLPKTKELSNKTIKRLVRINNSLDRSITKLHSMKIRIIEMQREEYEVKSELWEQWDPVYKSCICIVFLIAECLLHGIG